MPTWAISSEDFTFFARRSMSLTTSATARSTPRFRSMGFMPAATDFAPSRTIEAASTVAVVVPSPATSLDFEATSRTMVGTRSVAKSRFEPARYRGGRQSRRSSPARDGGGDDRRSRPQRPEPQPPRPVPANVALSPPPHVAKIRPLALKFARRLCTASLRQLWDGSASRLLLLAAWSANSAAGSQRKIRGTKVTIWGTNTISMTTSVIAHTKGHATTLPIGTRAIAAAM